MITPIINGVSLLKLVTDLETQKNYNPSGGYGGLVPRFYKYGPLKKYFSEGFSHTPTTDKNWLWLLGCECGEVGCWPIEANIQITENTIIWHNITQPHRKDRDYSELSPFIFEKQQYLNALKVLLDPRLSGDEK